jgi:hypothetical protein
MGLGYMIILFIRDPFRIYIQDILFDLTEKEVHQTLITFMEFAVKVGTTALTFISTMILLKMPMSVAFIFTLLVAIVEIILSIKLYLLIQKYRIEKTNLMKHRILTIAITLACLISENNIYAQETQALTNEAIENYLFNQQYHAYQVGRLNKENGVGKRWYYRFRLMHITDVHANYELIRQAFRSNQGHLDVICNTGDDANGCVVKDAPAVINTFDSISSIVKTANVHHTPYINIKGSRNPFPTALTFYYIKYFIRFLK